VARHGTVNRAEGTEDGTLADVLITSVAASVILTVLLNLWLWLRPRRPNRPGHYRLEPWDQDGPSSPARPSPLDDGRSHRTRSSMKVYFPWKAVLALSVGLTITVNLIVALSR